MLSKKALIVALVLLAGYVSMRYVSAERVNPASNAIADSDNTAGTIVLRDASGNFSAGTVTASVTGNTSGVHTGSVVGTTGSFSSGVVWTPTTPANSLACSTGTVLMDSGYMYRCMASGFYLRAAVAWTTY